MSFQQIVQDDNLNKKYHLEQAKLNKIQQKLSAQYTNKNIFSLASRKEQYHDITVKIGQELKENYDNLIIFGMGGSSLGGKTLCGFNFFNLGNENSVKKTFFIDNIHYHNLSAFLKNLDFDKTAFLIISKSLCQTLILLKYYQAELDKNHAKNLYFISEETDNPLTKIAKNYNREIIIHDKDIGGRYSCFTPVALIPAYFCDVNIEEFLAGGVANLENFTKNLTDDVKIGANYLNYCYEKKLKTQVFMPYLHRLYHLTYWYNQLLAESIGKKQHGITPLKALGSIDQHSVLQLFLDGPKDKFFTFLTSDTQNLGDKLHIPDYLKEDLAYFENNHLGDVIYANQEATIDTIKSKNNIVRKFNVNNFNEFGLGEVMMHFMLETIFFAAILDINPFDQPEVESGKVKAREIMSNKIKN